MTSRAVVVSAVFGMLATVAASTSGAQPEADGPMVHPALCETEHCRASDDVATFVQLQAHRKFSAAAADGKAEEGDAREEQAAQEEDDDADEDLEEEEDDEEKARGRNDENGEGCTWTNRRRDSGIPKKKPSSCASSCKNDISCLGYTTSRRRLPPALLETRPPALLETSTHQGGTRRRRCDFKTGASCPARCSMPEGKACDGRSSVLSGTSCVPGCGAGYSPSVDAPKSLSCTNGALSGPADYTCLLTAVSGKLTVKVLKAVNVDDGDWFAGESDAYVMLHLNGQEKRTTTVRDSNNPEWGESFQFEISSRAHSLSVVVYDEDDAAVDDSLGSGSIDLAEVIEKGGSKTYELPLNGSGKLSVQLSFHS